MGIELSDQPELFKNGDIVFNQINSSDIFPPFLTVYKTKEGGFILASGGYIMSRDEYERFSERVEAFYEMYTDEDIEQNNREIEQGNQERRNAKVNTPERMKPARALSPGFIYLVKCDGFYKIGKSKTVSKRIETFETIYPHDLQVILVARVADMRGTEEFLHMEFDSQRVKGEWFNLTDEDIAWIKSQHEHFEDWRATR